MSTLTMEQLAGEWLRALRGRRSQRGLSRRLGYRSNIVYRWESGRCWPTAATFFSVMQRLRLDVPAALERFFHDDDDPALRSLDLISAAGVGELLQRMRHATPIVELAERSGHNRFAVARWLNGRAQPRLPELLRLVDACTDRVLDFVAAFTDPASLPSLRGPWRELQAARALAYDLPESHLVLRAIELRAYRALPAHEEGWIARRVGLSLEQERTCLRLLQQARQIDLNGGRYRVSISRRIDMRADPARAKALRAHWIETALARLRADTPGVYGYNLFSISERDLLRLHELHRDYHERVRALVAASEPDERVVLFCTQLLALDRPE